MHRQEAAAMTWGDLPRIPGNAPGPGRGAGSPRQELCGEEQGLQPVGDSGSTYQPCGCPPPPVGAGWADCIRLPGNISSFLFLKAHNSQSDISPDDFKRHFNHQLQPTPSYALLTNPTLLTPQHVHTQQGK